MARQPSTAAKKRRQRARESQTEVSEEPIKHIEKPISEYTRPYWHIFVYGGGRNPMKDIR